MSECSQDFIPSHSKPFPFCPGCSHTTIFEVLNQALNELKFNVSDVVVVSDIGCIGIGDKHYACHTFHGLHGRSITYATGIKLANPKLNVIVLIGDGGVGIGATHFLNAARRNIGINVIVANNFNYGMTGGQHSVTTPTGGVTATTTAGNIEQGMDLCGLAQAAGGNFAARKFFMDKDLKDTIKEAILHPGFSMIDIWEICVPYFSKSNELNKKRLTEMQQESGHEMGVICKRDKAAYEVLLNQNHTDLKTDNPLKPRPVNKVWNHQLKHKTGLFVAGAAGQKIKSATVLFCEAALASGLQVSARYDYPVTVMTGHSTSEVILDKESIFETGLNIPEYLLITSEEGLKQSLDFLKLVDENSVVITFPEFEKIQTRAQIKVFNPETLGVTVKKTNRGLFLLAAWILETKLIEIEALIQTIQKRQKPEIAGEALEMIEKIKSAFSRMCPTN